MKKLIAIMALLASVSVPALAQEGLKIDESGKTYYDEGRTKVKEVFETKKVIKISSNSGPGERTVKDGLYFMYDKSGKKLIEGHYKDDKKSGEWKYFDTKGKVTKTEQYENGELKQD